MDKIAIVMNPNSGRQSCEQLEPWLRLRLRGRLELLKIAPGVDAAKWARERADAGVSRIIAIGGDGTFRSIAAALIGTETPLGLVAAGTNNNIAAVVGLPHDPHEAVEIALDAEPQWIKAGRVGDYVFFEGAGVGLEADLWPIGEAFVRHRFREIIEAPLKVASDRAYDLHLEIDPQGIRETVRAFTMTISNTPETGAHLKLAPGIDIRDPALTLTVYHDMGRLDLVASAHALRQGHKGHGYTVSRYPFMKLKIEAEHPCRVHADGTLIGTLPIEVVSIPHAVRVALPTPGTVLTPRPTDPDPVANQPEPVETS
ncbi:MAG TPA: diacylglycerol kinase family protein [Candidatus Dormibacteraeota bacterium]|nr:diacylglycerol kinase family protein [Candidatus Dormibacteraeota bacterium]